MSVAGADRAAGGCRRVPGVTLAVCLGVLLVWIVPGASAGLVFDRSAILRGELWRIATAELVHFSPSHLGWNLLVFAPAAAWLEAVDRRRLAWLLGGAGVAIGCALLALQPGLERYAGLSGLGAGVVTLLALTQGREPRTRWIWAAVLAAVVLKVGVELTTGDPLTTRFADAAIVPVPLAHIVGVLTAVAVHLAGRWRGAGLRA